MNNSIGVIRGSRVSQKCDSATMQASGGEKEKMYIDDSMESRNNRHMPNRP